MSNVLRGVLIGVAAGIAVATQTLLGAVAWADPTPDPGRAAAPTQRQCPDTGFAGGLHKSGPMSGPSPAPGGVTCLLNLRDAPAAATELPGAPNGIIMS